MILSYISLLFCIFWLIQAICECCCCGCDNDNNDGGDDRMKSMKQVSYANTAYVLNNGNKILFEPKRYYQQCDYNRTGGGGGGGGGVMPVPSYDYNSNAMPCNRTYVPVNNLKQMSYALAKRDNSTYSGQYEPSKSDCKRSYSLNANSGQQNRYSLQANSGGGGGGQQSSYSMRANSGGGGGQQTNYPLQVACDGQQSSYQLQANSTTQPSNFSSMLQNSNPLPSYSGQTSKNYNTRPVDGRFPIGQTSSYNPPISGQEIPNIQIKQYSGANRPINRQQQQQSVDRIW